MTDPHQNLAPAEQRDLQQIVTSAKASGWIDPACEVTAQGDDDSVVITLDAGTQKASLSYERNERWPYRFLVDLAHGVWKDFIK